MSRRVNPRNGDRLPRYSSQDGGHDRRRARDFECALGLPKRRSGVSHVVNKADPFPFYVRPSRCAKNAPHGLGPFGGCHARATVQGPDIFRSDQCGYYFSRPASRRRRRQNGRRLKSHGQSSPPMRGDGNPYIHDRRIDTALNRIRQMLPQQSIQRESSLEVEYQRLQHSFVLTDANEMIESKGGLSQPAWRTPSVEQEMRTSIFAARLAIVAAEATLQVQSAGRAQFALFSPNAAPAGRAGRREQQVHQPPADTLRP